MEISHLPEHLRHSEHEGVMQEETQSPTQEVKPEVPPQSAQEEEPKAPPLSVLTQQLCFFCWHGRTTGPGPGPGQYRTCRLVPTEEQTSLGEFSGRCLTDQ